MRTKVAAVRTIRAQICKRSDHTVQIRGRVRRELFAWSGRSDLRASSPPTSTALSLCSTALTSAPQEDPSMPDDLVEFHSKPWPPWRERLGRLPVPFERVRVRCTTHWDAVNIEYTGGPDALIESGAIESTMVQKGVSHIHIELDQR